jgi:hypothetical protein
MQNEQKEFLKQRTNEVLQEKPYLKPLRKRLLSLGGKFIILWNGNNGVNVVAHLLGDGRLFSNRGVKVVEGEPSQCHDNAFALWKTKPDDYLVVTGYGLSNDAIWRPHSWCVDRRTGKIIETTERRTKYFGVEFSKAESDEEEEAVRKHRKSASQKSRSKSKARKENSA